MSNEELVEMIQAGKDKKENLERLWLQNKGLVGIIAKHYVKRERMEDLMQQGYIGLQRATEDYDPNAGTTFCGYALQWIRQSMARYAYCNSRTIRIPVHQVENIYRYQKFCASFEKENSREPTDTEICHAMDMSIKSLENLKMDLKTTSSRSLDDTIGEDKKDTLGDFITGSENPEDAIIKAVMDEELSRTVRDILTELPADQRKVLELKYWNDQTYDGISEIMQISVNKVRRLHELAVQSLNVTSRADRLRPFLPDSIESIAYNGTVSNFKRTFTSSTEKAAIKLMLLEYDI